MHILNIYITNKSCFLLYKIRLLYYIGIEISIKLIFLHHSSRNGAIFYSPSSTSNLNTTSGTGISTNYLYLVSSLILMKFGSDYILKICLSYSLFNYINSPRALLIYIIYSSSRLSSDGP